MPTPAPRLARRPSPRPLRLGARRVRAAVFTLLMLAAAAVAGLVVGGLVGDRSSAASGGGHSAAPASGLGAPSPPRSGDAAPDRLPRDRQGGLGEADGLVPDGVTAFGDGYSAVSGLDPALLGALRRATAAARRDGVGLEVESGWRSAAYQEQLWRDAVARYGSEAEAARWVASPRRSAHVAGAAVDVAPAAGAAWLSDHGARYGLCRIYRNEPWHFQHRPESVRRGCPAMYADATDDPRLAG